jgi:hypothetical protein
MNRFLNILGISIFLILSLCVLGFSQQEERLTITTYYPSPYGSYRELRAQRMAIGRTYYDGRQYYWEGTNPNIPQNASLIVEGDVGIGTHTPNSDLHIYNEGGVPGSTALRLEYNYNSPVIGGSTSSLIGDLPSDWVFLANSNNGTLQIMNPTTPRVTIDNAGNVGIGTSNPQAIFQVQNGTVLFNGTIGNTPVSGGGRRLMWIPAKAEFRAGEVIGDAWDDNNIGLYSVAMGLNTIAAGRDCTVAGGQNNVISDTGRTCNIGGGFNNTILSSVWSTIGGGNSNRVTANTDITISGGGFNEVSGDAGTIGGGRRNKVTNFYSTIGGGTDNTVTGESSVIPGGDLNVVSGQSSFAAGESNTVAGTHSFAFGRNLVVSSDNTFVFGYSASVNTPDTFIIASGNVGIGTPAPSAKLEVNGTVKINSGGARNTVVCWRNDGQTLGYCSGGVGPGGTCNCQPSSATSSTSTSAQ